MKLTAREIISKWIDDDINLVGIERSLELRPFGMLREIYESEGPSEPALEALLNLTYLMPFLIDVADNGFVPKDSYTD